MCSSAMQCARFPFKDLKHTFKDPKRTFKDLKHTFKVFERKIRPDGGEFSSRSGQTSRPQLHKK